MRISALFVILTLLTYSTAVEGSRFTSDDFSGGFRSDIWTFIDPVGDCNLSVAGGAAEINVPGGVSHDVWTGGIMAPRIVQAVDNNDFEIAVKFESIPSQQFQIQGILVENDATNFIRYDIHYDGQTNRLFLASFYAGVPITLANQAIDISQCYYLRVTRSGNHFIFTFSYDNIDWISGAEIERNITVNHVGIFAGNAGFAVIPEFNCRIDYAFNTSRPIRPEDGQQERFELAINVQGSGEVIKNPQPCTCSPEAIVSPQFDFVMDCRIDFYDFAVMADLWLNEGDEINGDVNYDGIVDFRDIESIAGSWLVSYMPTDCNDANSTSFYRGQQVELTALPDEGWVFSGWSGAVTDSNNPIVVTLRRNMSVTAAFIFPDAEPPLISGVEVQPRNTTAVITWQTNEPATSRVIYGLDPNYSDGEIVSLELVTEHYAALSELLPGSIYYCLIEGEDGNGNKGSYELTFTTDENNQVIVSDDFTSLELNEAVWRFIDPLGDANLVLTGSAAAISVPAGLSHDIWTMGINSPRLMQNIDNIDFDVQVKFLSSVLERFQTQGLLVEESENDFIRYDVHSDGSNTHLFAVSFVNNLPDTVLYETIYSEPPYYLRMIRSGDMWELLFSSDGIEWTSVQTFIRNINASAVGFFGGNAGNGSSPAFTAIVDYFFDSNSPIIPEDIEFHSITTEIAGAGQVVREPDMQWYPEGQEVILTAIADPNWQFIGWEGDVAVSNENPASVVVRKPLRAKALFVQTSLSTEIDIWYGKEQHFGHNGIPQRWVNILGNIVNSETVGSLTYSLNGGAEQVLSMGFANTMDPGNNPRLVRKGDFNIEIAYNELLHGQNEVTIKAVDLQGQVYSEVVDVNYHSGNSSPLPRTINWQAVSRIEEAAQIVDGKWVLTSNGPRIVEAGYDRPIAIGDVNWTDYEVTVPVTIHQKYYAVGQVGDRPGFGLALRWPGHTQWGMDKPSIGWWPYGALVMFSWTTDSHGSFNMRGNQGSYIAYGPLETAVLKRTYMLKMRVTTIIGVGGLYQFKAWLAGQPEPSQWLLEGMQTMSDPQKGSLLILGHYVDATFGNITITPIP